jgi:hypothetical protein
MAQMCFLTTSPDIVRQRVSMFLPGMSRMASPIKWMIDGVNFGQLWSSFKKTKEYRRESV